MKTIWCLNQKEIIINCLLHGLFRIFMSYPQYHQTFNISRTKSKNLDVYRLFMQLSLPNPL